MRFATSSPRLLALIVLSATPFATLAAQDKPLPPSESTDPPVNTAPDPAPEPGDVSPDDEIEIVWPLHDPPEHGDYVRLGGLITATATDYGDDNAKDDGFDLDAIDLIATGRFGNGVFLIDIDTLGEDTKYNLREAWIEGPVAPHHWLRVGQLRSALSSEFATREEDLPVPGYGFNTWMTGRYGPGVRIDGDLANDDSSVWWGATLTGIKEGDLRKNDVGGPQLAVRFDITPTTDARGEFEGAFFGGAVAWAGDVHGPLHLENPVDVTVITTSSLHGDERQSWALEGGWRTERARAGAEFANVQFSDVDTGPSDETFSDNEAFTAWVAYNVQGRTPAWKRGAWQPYMLKHGDEMPIELGLRFSHANIDGDFFGAGLAAPGLAARNVDSLTASAAAYVTALTKVSLGWVRTNADAPVGNFGGDHNDDSFVMRLDQRF